MAEAKTDGPWERELESKVGTFSPAFWSGVVELQLRRLEAGIAAHRERRPHPDRPDPLDGFGASLTHDLGPVDADAFFLLIALHRLVTIAEFYERRSATPKAVRDARARFERDAPDVKDARDVLTHLDSYLLGEGRRPEVKAEGFWWPPVGIDPERDEIDLRVGTLHVELKRAARAAITLARSLSDLAVPPATPL
jgi:hypothetical protein